LKRNGIQIGAKDIENLIVTMMLKKELWKDIFAFFFANFVGNQLNKF
jgi:hypothetical protein